MPRPKTLSVSQFARLVKQSLGRAFSCVIVTGEVLDPLVSQRGHLYFRLADSEAELRVVVWRRDKERLSFVPAAGDSITVRGRLDFYPPKGELQIQAEALMRSGRGAKLVALDQLREKLKKEGLFDRPRRDLPTFPTTIGLVSSAQGAVLHDVYQSLQKRWPRATLLLSPSAVSGERAASELSMAVRRVQRRCDLLLICRGGGSFEELYPFSSEQLLRTVVACPVPVVAAIGHGSDRCLLDLVADHTAATPTAAAVLVSPDREESLRELMDFRRRLSESLGRRVARCRSDLNQLQLALKRLHPCRRVQVAKTEFSWWRDRLLRSLTQDCQGRRNALDSMRERLRYPLLLSHSAQHRSQVANLERRLVAVLSSRLLLKRLSLNDLKAKLIAADPGREVRRGYGLVKKDGRVISSALGRTPGEELEIQFADGVVRVRVSQPPTPSGDLEPPSTKAAT